ncbi:YegJ family protein [Pedobacter sp. 22163]|uniref:YegJ family protein n=1 Tax=Pedobacter sp. 22163 TaxID=3453883 RepID=UPI003F86D99A
MGLLSKIFGKKNVAEREGEPDMVYVPSEDERMNWAIEKANLTLWYFEESLKNQQPYQNYFSIKVLITDGDEGEHIWLTDPHFDDEGNLFGTVGNEPVNIRSVKFNQKIGIKRDLISDWMIIENGRLIGGYTIRAIRDGVAEKEKAAFDNSIGLYIDEGVDHFKANLETPEGAILAIEKAYNNKDIDAAIACKDFFEEAKSLLSVMKMEIDQDIINETAEVLKLSFINNIEEHGFPDFSTIQNAFPERKKVDETHWVITEVCWYPDGGKSVQLLNTYKSPKGWVVLGPAGPQE